MSVKIWASKKVERVGVKVPTVDFVVEGCGFARFVASAAPEALIQNPVHYADSVHTNIA